MEKKENRILDVKNTKDFKQILEARIKYIESLPEDQCYSRDSRQWKEAKKTLELIEKAQEYDKLTTMDKKLMQMSEDGKGFQVVRNAKGEPFQVIKQEEYMRLVDIENKYDNLVSGEVEDTLDSLKSLNMALCSPNVNFKLTNRLYENIKNDILAQAEELDELKKKANKFDKLKKYIDKLQQIVIPHCNGKGKIPYNVLLNSYHARFESNRQTNQIKNELKQLCEEEVKE